MRVKRTLTYVGAWLAATTAAVTVTWLGVRDVMRGAVIDQPDAIPVLRPVSAPADPPPQPPPAPPPPPDPVSTPPVPQQAAPPPEPTDDVRGYDVLGGQVVLAVSPDGAELVSATPNQGYTVQTWQNEGWLRVEFTRGEHGSTVIASWYEHPTTVERFEH
ncbi:hypothetical protein [Saccharopolyspora rosea]|uniref:SH3 domain-containing protein n=1 Tax=Saccharopolyspora rosea TaxID=524884 RepID=A0ABW3FL61_9PSEU|nr:hypothetical protein [Saccharopolyspora rosea]